MWGLAQVNYGALDIAHSLGVRSSNTFSLSVALTQFPLSVSPTQIPHIFWTEWDWITGGGATVLTGTISFTVRQFAELLDVYPQRGWKS